MMRLATERGMPVTTSTIEASSLRTGIATATCVPSRAGRSGFAGSAGASMTLKTPAQAAARAGRGRLIGQQRIAKGPIGLAIPDFAQRLLGGIAQRVVLIAVLRERRDAARQGAPVGGEIHDGPRPAAHGPRRISILALEARARLGGGARCA